MTTGTAPPAGAGRSVNGGGGGGGEGLAAEGCADERDKGDKTGPVAANLHGKVDPRNVNNDGHGARQVGRLTQQTHGEADVGDAHHDALGDEVTTMATDEGISSGSHRQGRREPSLGRGGRISRSSRGRRVAARTAAKAMGVRAGDAIVDGTVVGAVATTIENVACRLGKPVRAHRVAGGGQCAARKGRAGAGAGVKL